MVAGIAHEVNNPIGFVDGTSRALMKPNSNPPISTMVCAERSSSYL
jgi:signal transduction histidine kinase